MSNSLPKTKATASLVEVLPTVPLTAIIFGLNLANINLASKRKIAIIIFLKKFFSILFISTFDVDSLPVWRNFVIIKQKFSDVHKRFGQCVGRILGSLRFDDKQKGQELGVKRRSVTEKSMDKFSFGVSSLAFLHQLGSACFSGHAVVLHFVNSS